jgi:membrane protein
VVRTVGRRINEDQLTLLAAGVAFYAALALFPALAALLGLYGLVADPARVGAQLQGIRGAVPDEVALLLEQQLTELASREWGRLSVSVVFTLGLSLWSATQGTFAFMRGLSIVFGRPDQRGMVRKYGVALSLTAGTMAALAGMLSLLAIVPPALASLGLPLADPAVHWARWPVTVLVVASLAGQLYRRGPQHETRPRRVLTVGSVAAALLQLAASGGFSWYVSHLGTYNETHGSLGTVVVLLMWLYLFALSLLMGAEIDAVWTGIRPAAVPAVSTTRDDATANPGS